MITKEEFKQYCDLRGLKFYDRDDLDEFDPIEFSDTLCCGAYPESGVTFQPIFAIALRDDGVVIAIIAFNEDCGDVEDYIQEEDFREAIRYNKQVYAGWDD